MRTTRRPIPARGPRRAPAVASAAAAAPAFAVEPLEGRTLFAVTVLIDYSLDTNGFFADANRRQILQAAADAIASRFGDQLSAINPNPDAGNTWSASVFHPGTTATVPLDNLVIPANTIRVFAGGAELGNSVLGIGGPSFNITASGTPEFQDTALNRGQGDTEGSPATDFGPWGGTISFDLQPIGGWFFNLNDDNIGGGQVDFYSVAIHEMGHLLGFGLADSWDNLIDDFVGVYDGPASEFEYDGPGKAPIQEEGGHWAANTMDAGQEALLSPSISPGIRKELTALDIAGFDDLGWEIPLRAALNPVGATTANGAPSKTFSVTYSHYTNLSGNSIGNNDITVTGPNGFSAPAVLVGTTGSGRSFTGTYSIAAPGGSFDAADSGQYTIRLNADAVGDAFGNFTTAGTLGSFAIDISPPSATLATDDVTRVGGAVHVFTVTYADANGIENGSIDVADLTVTRDSDGLVLPVTGAQSDAGADANSRVATYMAAAPGGLWDISDSGTYTITMNENQVRDNTGTPVAGGVLGTFDVSVNAVAFSSGNPLNFTDASGDPVTITLTGPGSGQVIFPDTGNADAGQVVVNNVAVSSALTITAGGAGTAVGELTVNGSLKSLTFRNADLAGAMNVTGTIPKIAMRNAGGSIALNGAGGAPAAITLAQAKDLTLTTASPIRSLRLNEWLDTDATPDLITTPTLSALAARGAFEAGVSAGAIGRHTAGGALNGAVIRATGSIASITVGSVADSSVFVGVRDEVTTLPDDPADFVDPATTLGAFTVRSRSAGSFRNTLIAAGNVGKVNVGTVTTGNNGTTFGVAGLTAKSITGATDAGDRIKASRLDDPSGSQTLGNFVIRLL